MSNSAFYFVDGIPTKGLWVELDEFTDESDILEALAAAGYIPRDEDGDPEYGGDLLVADIEGDLARCFYASRSCTLDLDGLKEALSYCDTNQVDEEAVAAYVDDRGSWDQRDFEEAFCGQHESEEAYAEELVDELGYLEQMPESLRCYFDYEKFARDLFISDYRFTGGYVFRNT